MWTSSTLIYFMVHHLWMLILWKKVPLMDQILHHLKDGWDLRWNWFGISTISTGWLISSMTIVTIFYRMLQNPWHEDTKPGDWFKKHGIQALYASGSFYLLWEKKAKRLRTPYLVSRSLLNIWQHFPTLEGVSIVSSPHLVLISIFCLK